MICLPIALLLLNAASTSAAGTALTSSFAWTSIGPQPMTNEATILGGSPLSYATGRVTSVAVGTTEQGTPIIVGTAGGGVWVSTDGANTFSSFTDSLPQSGGTPVYGPSQAIGAVAIDPTSTPTTVYAATGEGNQSGDSYYGIGIFKSADLGKTIDWLLYPGMSLTPGGTFGHPSFTRIVIVSQGTGKSPYLYAAGVGLGNSSNRAGAGYRESGPTDRGLFESTDGGATWSRTASFAGAACTPNCDVDDVAVDPNAPNIVYAAVDTIGVYYSTDSGSTWTAVCSQSNPQCGLNVGRISLATETGTTGKGTVYAIYASPLGQNNDAYVGLYESTNNGVTWAQQTVPHQQIVGAPSCYEIDGDFNLKNEVTGCTTSFTQYAFGHYDQILAVSPVNPSTIYFGGVAPYISNDSGMTWTALAARGGTHPDQHAAQFAPCTGNNPCTTNTIYTGTDGGLFTANLQSQSVFAASTANQSIAAGQIQGLGSNWSSPSTVLAGFQDNGTQMYSGSAGWPAVEGGDGGVTLFDHLPDPKKNTVFWAYHTFASGYSQYGGQYPDISMSEDGGNTWNSSGPTTALYNTMKSANDAGAIFYPPFAVDPFNAHRILFGAHSVYSSTDGMQSWSQQTTSTMTGAGCGTSSLYALQDIEFSSSPFQNEVWATFNPHRSLFHHSTIPKI